MLLRLKFTYMKQTNFNFISDVDPAWLDPDPDPQNLVNPDPHPDPGQ